MLLCGIDEAGRGPVLGNLVIAGVLIEESSINKVKKLGVKDSKLLNHKQREEMFDKILAEIKKYHVIHVTPKEIDDAVLSESGFNLNWLEAHKTAEIINSLNPKKVIVDCPSTNIPAYTRYLKNLIKDKRIKILAEHKADRNHVVVGAASIIAKVLRDRNIKELKQQYSVEFGSGYMSDPLTQKFLKEHYSDYPFFRKSWSSWAELKKSKQQRTLTTFMV